VAHESLLMKSMAARTLLERPRQKQRFPENVASRHNTTQLATPNSQRPTPNRLAAHHRLDLGIGTWDLGIGN
jgi:hypothetical protein